MKSGVLNHGEETIMTPPVATRTKPNTQAGWQSLLKRIRLFGPKAGRRGLVSFFLNGVHAHDVATAADQWGLAMRGGHHCTQPLLHRLGVESTARASFYFYNTEAEVDRLIEVVREIQRFFGA